MLGIIGAMPEEVNELLKLMDVEEEKENSGYKFYKGKLGQKETVVVQGGIGKVNATISATLLVRDFDIDHVVNIGTAGGLSQEEEVGDIVISEKVVHHDFDLTGFGRAYGEVPGFGVGFEADHEMVRLCKQILDQNKARAYTGLIASGDAFIHTKAQVEKILSHFPETMCAEMEAASVAQVCTVFKIPFIITRGLSDIYNKGNNAIQFDEYLKKAAAVSATMCYSLAQQL